VSDDRLPLDSSYQVTETPMRRLVTLQGKAASLRWLALREIALNPSEGMDGWTFHHAIVDRSAVGLGLPQSAIRRLQLSQRPSWNHTRNWFDAVVITLNDRECATDVWKAPGSLPIVGHAILALLDFVLDSQARKLVGNPAHGGEHVLELY
jgi:hypothetical protein